jgi:RNA polymerase sigma-70 factor (ECF subfamily)
VPSVPEKPGFTVVDGSRGHGAISVDDSAQDEITPMLVARAAGGDAAAWARLYQDNFARLYRDVRYLSNTAEVTEEIVQDTFAIALAKLGSYDRRAPFLAWLRGIAQNLVRKHWRQSIRRERAYARLRYAEAAEDRGGPAHLHEQGLRADALKQALARLPSSLREAFVLREVQGLSVEETAARLAISEGNVRVRATRARAKIRKMLWRMGWLEDGRP